MQFPSSQVNWPSRQPVNLRKVVYGSPRKIRKNYHQRYRWHIFVSHLHCLFCFHYLRCLHSIGAKGLLWLYMYSFMDFRRVSVGWTGRQMDGSYPLDCYNYLSNYAAKNGFF